MNRLGTLFYGLSSEIDQNGDLAAIIIRLTRRYNCIPMAEELHKMINKKVIIMANDGRVFIGTMRGIDQVTNLILEDVQERVFSMEKGMQIEDSDVLLFRGEDVAVISIFDENKDKEMDWAAVRANPIEVIRH